MLEENKTKIDGEQSQTLDSKIKNFLLKLRIVFRKGGAWEVNRNCKFMKGTKFINEIYLFINMGLLLSVLVRERI